MRVPLPSAAMVGREGDVARLSEMLRRIPVAVIYGVAGVGKSTLAFAVAERWVGPVVYRKVGREDTLSALVDDLRRQLANGPVRELASDEERLDRLAEQLDETRALCVLDDIHALDPRVRSALLDGFGQALRRGRVLATSRELVGFSACGPDRFELRLGGLDEAQARAMWATLDDLYRPSAGFEAAFTKARGNPLLLRRAHAGGLESEDPIAATVRGLSPAALRIAGALALTEQRLPSGFLLGMAPRDTGGTALRELLTKMVVEIDATTTCSIHDIFREAIRLELAQEEQRSLHEALARGLRTAPLDPVVRTREVSHHLRAAGRMIEAGRFLLEESAELVRHGAAGELLRGIDAIPADQRIPELQIARARTLGRLGELRAACAELERLLHAGVPPRSELLLSYAQLIGRIFIPQ